MTPLSLLRDAGIVLVVACLSLYLLSSRRLRRRFDAYYGHQFEGRQQIRAAKRAEAGRQLSGLPLSRTDRRRQQKVIGRAH